jgi:SAM-dependent methyltransferase
MTPPSIVTCRTCGQPFVIDEISDGCGYARCGCREIPFAEGVLVPDDGGLRSRLLEAIGRGDRRQAAELILGSHARKVQWLNRFGIRPTFEAFARHRLLSGVISTLHLRRLLRTFPPKHLTRTIVAAAQWNPYIRHRFSSPSMLATIPLLGLLRNRDGMVLDAPCGMGHLSFLLSKLVAPQRLVSMDLSPAFVYSTRRFFVPEVSAAIVHDMNVPLPLPAGTFGAIFCADAFHYVSDRASLAREFMRIIRHDGVVVIAHAHNRLQPNAYTGHAMSPAEYRGLFESYCVRVVPERYVLDAYLDNTPLDLTREFSEEELNLSPALDIVAAKSPEILSVVPPIRDQLIETARNPRLNGLYRMRRRGGRIVFERSIPECLRDDFGEYRQILAADVSIPASELGDEEGRQQFSNLAELLAKHVLVDVPENY